MTDGGNFRAFEIKSAQTFDTDFVKGLTAFSKVYGKSVLSKSVIYAGELENDYADCKLLNYKNISRYFE